MATTRAVPDHADLAGGAGQPAQVARGAVDVADELLVGIAALRAHERRGVVRARAGRLARVQVRAERRVPVGREPAHDLLGARVVAGQVVDHHHAAAGAPLVGRAK